MSDKGKIKIDYNSAGVEQAIKDLKNLGSAAEELGVSMTAAGDRLGEDFLRGIQDCQKTLDEVITNWPRGEES